MRNGFSSHALQGLPRVSALAVLFTLAISTGASVATAESSDEEQVRSAVDVLLERLGGQRLFAMANLFTKNAIIVTARKHGGGYETRVETATEWLTRMQGNPSPQPFEEVLSNIEVTIDGGLAYLRADFKIIRNAKEVSSGVDVFTLVRKLDEWKVASIAYTSIPTPQD